MPKKNYKSAEVIGKTFAVLQHSFDKLFEWGFKKMKENSNKKKKTKNESKVVGILRTFGSFLGETGEHYYKKYENLKKKEK